MRWDRLFAELEAQTDDVELEERDVLVDELRDGVWAETSWLDLLGGEVVLDVLGAGRIEGQAVLVTARLIQLQTDRLDHVVSTAAVASVLSAERRADAVSTTQAALGWGHVFRALRGAGDGVLLRRPDSSTVNGTVTTVGRDFVRLREPSGRDQVVPFGAVGMVSGQT